MKLTKLLLILFLANAGTTENVYSATTESMASEMYQLGLRFLYGHSVPRIDVKSAFQRLGDAVKEGHPEATWLWGRMWSSYNMPALPGRAKRYDAEVAAAEYLSCAKEMGIDDATVLQALKEKGERRTPLDDYRLADLMNTMAYKERIESGRGATLGTALEGEEKKEYLDLLASAHEGGVIAAHYPFSKECERGTGSDALKGAELGDPVACCGVGFVYYNPLSRCENENLFEVLGVDSTGDYSGDHAKAISFLNRAFKVGFIVACIHLISLYQMEGNDAESEKYRAIMVRHGRYMPSKPHTSSDTDSCSVS